MRDEASWFLCLSHFMAFVIYAWALGLWDGGLCIPNLFCFRIAFEYNEHSLSLHISFDYRFAIPSFALNLAYSLQPQDSTAAHRSQSGISSSSVPSTAKTPHTGVQTHTVHFILRQETADISITITLSGRSIRQTVYCP